MNGLNEKTIAVIWCLRHFSNSMPQWKKTMDPSNPDDLAEMARSWEMSLPGYGPDLIMEAGRRVIRTLASDERAICADVTKLARACKEISYERFLSQQSARSAESDKIAKLESVDYQPPEGIAKFCLGMTSKERGIVRRMTLENGCSISEAFKKIERMRGSEE